MRLTTALVPPSSWFVVDGNDSPSPRDGGVAEREQHPGAVEPDEPEAGAAQTFVRPPPLAPPGVRGILFGRGPFLEVIAVFSVPCIEFGEPVGGPVHSADFGEPACESEQRPAGLALGPVRQVDAGVAQHVHEATLRANPLPPGPGGRQTPLASVAHQQSRPFRSSEELPVGVLGLRGAPLPCDRLAVITGQGQQAPAIGNIRPVRHHIPVGTGGGRQDRFHAPAPRDTGRERLTGDTEPGGGLAHGLLAGDPCDERAELGPARRVPAFRDRAQPARIAPPPLGAGLREPVPAHRAPAQGALPRPRRLVPAHRPSQPEKSSTPPD